MPLRLNGGKHSWLFWVSSSFNGFYQGSSYSGNVIVVKVLPFPLLKLGSKVLESFAPCLGPQEYSKVS